MPGGASGEARYPSGLERLAPWVLLGPTLILYAPVIAARATFPAGDFLHHFFPFSLFQHAALAHGQLPVWNPYTYGGHPFLADVQAAVFYPVSNLLLLLTLPVAEPGWRLYFLHWDALLHTWLGGLFLYWLARDLTRSTWAGLFGGVTFALSGYITGYPPVQLAVLRTAVWLPLLWWALARAWTAPERWRWWLLAAGALTASILAGHSQTLLLILYGTAGWIAWLAASGAGRGAQVRARVTGLATVFIGSIGVSAAQLWPSWEFARYSVRASVDYAFVSGGFPWHDLWQMLLPGVLTTYSPLYVGAGGALLAFVAVSVAVARPRRHDADFLPDTLIPWRGTVLCIAAITLLALLAATGSNGPLFPILYHIAPGWRYFRGQERAAVLVAAGLSLLAAYGAALGPRLSPSAARRIAMVGGAVIVAGVYAFGLLWQLPGRTAVDHGGYLIAAALTLLFGAATALVVAVPGWKPRRRSLLLAIAILNLLWAGAGTNLSWGTPWTAATPSAEVAAVRAATSDTAAGRGLPGRVYNEYRVYDDYGMVVRVEEIWGSSPLRLDAFDDLFDGFPLDRMWRLLGVRHVLTWRRELFGPTELLGQWPQETDTTYLHRLPDTAARAWLASTVVVTSPEDTITGLADHEVSLDDVAWVPPDAGLAPVQLPHSAASVGIERLTEHSLAYTVESEHGGLLVVSENWLPGWRITGAVCNRGLCPIADSAGQTYLTPVRADLALIGIWLPPGLVSFHLDYRPSSVILGLWISGLTLVMLGCALALRTLARWMRRR